MKMKAIILAAGFGTRLEQGLGKLTPSERRIYEPLIKDKPKALIPVAGKPLIEYVLEKIQEIKEIDDIYIITNNRFYPQFMAWNQTYSFSKKIEILNDGANTNENRLGAIRDLEFVINEENIDDDVLVLAGDTLFDFNLADFTQFFYLKKSDVITVYEEEKKKLARRGIVELNQKHKVLSFEEKPAEPKSNLASPPIYLFLKETLPMIKEYLNEGNDPDAPGNFIKWLCRKKDVFAFRFKGKRYDIGDMQDYINVNRVFEEKVK